jgi:hypothetical protein
MKRTVRFGQLGSADGVAGNVPCARAARGHATAAPPRRVMKWRLLMPTSIPVTLQVAAHGVIE